MTKAWTNIYKIRDDLKQESESHVISCWFVASFQDRQSGGKKIFLRAPEDNSIKFRRFSMSNMFLRISCKMHTSDDFQLHDRFIYIQFYLITHEFATQQVIIIASLWIESRYNCVYIQFVFSSLVERENRPSNPVYCWTGFPSIDRLVSEQFPSKM